MGREPSSGPAAERNKEASWGLWPRVGAQEPFWSEEVEPSLWSHLVLGTAPDRLQCLRRDPQSVVDWLKVTPATPKVKSRMLRLHQGWEVWELGRRSLAVQEELAPKGPRANPSQGCRGQPLGP